MTKRYITFAITGLLCAIFSNSAVYAATLEEAVETSGPTLLLDYQEGGPGNPVDTFMYFVPLVAPTGMTVRTDPDTTLSAHILSRTSKEKGREFTTTCMFEVRGSGVYEAFFDPEEMIAFGLGKDSAPRTLKNLLHSIRVDGPMKGKLEISGTTKNGQREVNRLVIRFDLGGASPVSAHLYDVKSDGKMCLFENRFHEQTARIDSLSFTRGGIPPKMTTEVGAVSGEKKNEGIFASFKAMLANLFLPPLPIADRANETMLNFGMALDTTQPVFTFPYAQNLRQTVTAVLAKKDVSPNTTRTIQ